MKRFFLLLGLFAGLSSLHAAPLAAEGYKFIKSVGGMDEYSLQSNGLQVLLMPEHSSPTLTFMVTYRVGSKNEVTGSTGATHLLEHLMFKGTTERNRSKGNNVDQLLERTGARYNATTWLDRTNYYENVGSQHLAEAIAMEADRMRHLALLESDRQPEMTVVRNEFERGENSPFQALYKEIYQAAFVAHPYHHSTIGHRSDIEKVSIDKLREFYDTYYWPNNATVTVVGDFQAAQALALVRQHFGVYPSSAKPIPSVYTEEPEQMGPRRVVVKRAGQLGVVAIAHKIPAASHADYAAVSLLSAILTDGKNSRLYKALTDKNLSTGVSSDVGYNADPSLHMLFLPLAPDVKHEEVEKIALQELNRLKHDGVSKTELEAAIAKTLADSAFDRDGSFAVAGKLNESIAAGDWSLYYRLDESTRHVTVADIQRVAQRYFNEDQSTTGWFIPTGAAASGGKGAAQRLVTAGPNFYRDPEQAQAALALTGSEGSAVPLSGISKIAPRVQRSQVQGIDLLVYPSTVKDVITLRGSLPAGRAQAPANPAVPILTAMLLDQGTQQHDKFAIAEQLEAVGANIGFHAGVDTLDIHAKLLKKDLPLVLDLLAEQLRTPAFSAEEFAKAKKQYAGAIQRSLESTDWRAFDAFTRLAYPLGHPNRTLAPQALLAAIDAVQLSEVLAFHQSHYGPAQLTLVAVGDFDTQALQAQVGRAFAHWQGRSQAPLRQRQAPLADAPQQQTLEMPGKTSVSMVLGQASGLTYQHPDYQALRVATAIFGSGFTGRLMANVRDKEGLTYGIGAGLSGDTFNVGDWKISATFAPALLEQGLASTRRQLSQWYAQGVTAAEVDARKTNLIGAFQVGLATTDGMASSLLLTLERGFPLSWLDDYASTIQALSQAQINAAIKRYLKPQNMLLVQAGSLAPVKK